jgi:hypothetical protein
MQSEINFDNAAQWRSGATPKTVCFLQAVLISAAFAVLIQSIANVFWAFPAEVLHLTAFALALPVTWLLRVRMDSWRISEGAVSSVCFSRQSVLASFENRHEPVRMRITAIGRYWGALSLKLQTEQSAQMGVRFDRSVPVTFTLWESTLGKEKFRKACALVYWHARGSHD